MALPSPLYVAFQGLQTYFSDKDTATALSGGYVEFYCDPDRGTQKNVYKQTRLPNNEYEFVSIGSIVSLNASGAFSDPDNGNDIQVYAYPYDADGNIELYYLKVYSMDEVFQFDREAQPANAQGSLNPVSDFVDTVNEISNPQFIQVSFSTPSTTYSVSGSDQETVIAPDWSLFTTGTGTLTVTQQPIIDLPVDGNPPYMLGVTSLGLSGSTITLRQVFQSSPRLLLNAFINGSILVKSADGIPVPFTMVYYPLSGTEESFTILAAELSSDDGSYTTLSNTVDTASSTVSSIEPPSGYSYVDITFTSNVQVYISNVQLIGVENSDSSAQFLELSYSKQLDGLFHYYYPIVPVGTIIDYFGFGSPSHYLPCNYGSYSRTTYYQLFNTITSTESVTITSGLNTFTVVDGSVYSIGYGVEGTGIPSQATITNISTNTITISRNATASGSQTLRFFAAGNIFYETVTLTSGNPGFTVTDGTIYSIGMSLQSLPTANIPSATVISNIVGNTITMSNNAAASGSTVVYFFSPANGDGSTTFNVPDCRRRVMIGSDGNVLSSFPPGIGNQFGNTGGEELHTMTTGELVSHSHSIGYITSSSTGNVQGGASALLYTSTGTATQATGSGTPFNVMQPGLVTNKYIKYE